MIRDIHIQVLVLGSGPAGYSAAFRSADLGLSTILVEKYNQLGGVCLNVGCIPSKFLLHIAKVIKESQEISKQGVVFSDPKIDFNLIKKNKDKIINTLSNGLKSLSKMRKVDIINGIGTFIDSKTVLVKNNKENIHIHFQDVIIATGSKPITLPNIPNDSNYIWNSTQALSLNTIPKKLLIIGSGIIGLEMATFYSAIGSKVDVIDRCDQVLPFLDQDIIKIFLKEIKNNFNILLGTNIDNIFVKDNQVFVTLSNKINKEKKIYDAILIAVGRIPNIKELSLDKIGVIVDKNNFIIVDDQFKTNIPNIYAIGDVIGQPMLAHKGIHQGHIVSEVISGYKHYFDPIAIPSVAYTDPEIAWVGIHENEAIKRNINYEVATFPWNASGRAIVSNCSNGITKLIINKDNRKVIGGILVGRQAGELLSEITLAIEMGCDIEDISLTIHPHPTLCESIGLTAQILQGTVTDLMNLKI
ncbi:dihydrolipoyl dehydrogenase [Buchnera aphidicola]|uniref:Dihydrolipoyl dehydrogenase n=1 Tax=Buchnera aphidicola (Therioaphis trifolii) TaxID=1241884 RepID=A0A4D6YMU1_9GAMM|nr:dihydrolipoyl dehydrogenase [Buchnera aphidicola]QCI27148.1 dihydrolipoyl dehydrogenase [Buchnera aphidicola (Therioaphis trifolii)]